MPDTTLVLSTNALRHHRNLSAEADAIVKRLDGARPRTHEEARAIHDGLAELKRIQKHAEQLRRAEVDPLNERVDSINAAWRPLRDAIARVEPAAKRALLAFAQAERERVADEQRRAEEAAAKAASDRQEALDRFDRARSEGGRDRALAKAQEAHEALTDARLAIPEPASTTIRTDTGTSSIRNVWTFEIVGADVLDRRFLKPDTDAIRKAVNAGLRESPGLVIYQREEISVRT